MVDPIVPVIVELMRLVGKADPETVHKQRISRQELRRKQTRWASQVVKNPSCQCRRHKRLGFDPWVGKIPWRRAWQPTPVFLPGESHGQRGLAGNKRVGHH